MGSGGGDQPANIVVQYIMYKNCLHLTLHLDQHVRTDYRLYFLISLFIEGPFDDLNFILDIRITHGDTDKETVQLGLRQHLGARGAKWILRGNDHKWIRDRMGNPVYRDPAFLHDLQQCGLGFGGGPVDLIEMCIRDSPASGYSFFKRSTISSANSSFVMLESL